MPMPQQATRSADSVLLAETVVAHIRKSIATGMLRQGERVKELEISKALGMSRGPVREAVRRLSATGLLVSAPNLGSRVTILTDPMVRQAYQVREVLESLAARLAATTMTRAERMALVGVLDEHEEAMRAGQADTYPAGDADWDFHLKILKGARNEFVWRICGEELRDIMTLMRAQHRATALRGRRALQEHRWVAEAIRDGIEDLAAVLMAQHIRASRNSLLTRLGSLPASDSGGSGHADNVEEFPGRMSLDEH